MAGRCDEFFCWSAQVLSSGKNAKSHQHYHGTIDAGCGCNSDSRIEIETMFYFKCLTFNRVWSIPCAQRSLATRVSSPHQFIKKALK